MSTRNSKQTPSKIDSHPHSFARASSYTLIYCCWLRSDFPHMAGQMVSCTGSRIKLIPRITFQRGAMWRRIESDTQVSTSQPGNRININIETFSDEGTLYLCNHHRHYGRPPKLSGRPMIPSKRLSWLFARCLFSTCLLLHASRVVVGVKLNSPTRVHLQPASSSVEHVFVHSMVATLHSTFELCIRMRVSRVP